MEIFSSVFETLNTVSVKGVLFRLPTNWRESRRKRLIVESNGLSTASEVGI